MHTHTNTQVAAERAACAVIALDSPGSNYRAVWAMTKHFPHVKVRVRICVCGCGVFVVVKVRVCVCVCG